MGGQIQEGKRLTSPAKTEKLHEWVKEGNTPGLRLGKIQGKIRALEEDGSQGIARAEGRDGPIGGTLASKASLLTALNGAGPRRRFFAIKLKGKRRGLF